MKKNLITAMLASVGMLDLQLPMDKADRIMNQKHKNLPDSKIKRVKHKRNKKTGY